MSICIDSRNQTLNLRDTKSFFLDNSSPKNNSNHEVMNIYMAHPHHIYIYIYINGVNLIYRIVES